MRAAPRACASFRGAPILAHEGDADFYRRKEPMTFCPTGRFGRLFLKTPLPHQPYEGFEPDIMMKDGDLVNLIDFGVDGLVRHTAGHTPGSIAVELASHDALVGDLVASGILIGGIAFTSRAMRPPVRGWTPRGSPANWVGWCEAAPNASTWATAAPWTQRRSSGMPTCFLRSRRINARKGAANIYRTEPAATRARTAPRFAPRVLLQIGQPSHAPGFATRRLVQALRRR